MERHPAHVNAARNFGSGIIRRAVVDHFDLHLVRAGVLLQNTFQRFLQVISLADCTSESLRTSKDAYQDLLCLESMEGEASSQRKQRQSFPQFKHSLRMRESNPTLQPVFSLAENQSLKSHTECKDLFKPRKGQPTHRANNQANCLGGAILF